MKTKLRTTDKILICLLTATIIIQQPMFIFAEDTKNIQSSLSQKTSTFDCIDEGIFNLNYNNNEVLASKGDKIESYLPREGIFKKNKFISIERNKKTLTSTPIDISIVSSAIDRTYPGAIQLANTNFINNFPNLVSVRRKPINISIDLPGMGSKNTVKVENPSYGNVKASIDELISNWIDKHSATHSLPSRIQYSESMAHSKSQISSALNIDGDILSNSLQLDFDSISKGEKQSMVVAYKQIFYTVSAEMPNNPSDLFDDSVTFTDLTRRGVSDKSPPLMVSNVDYGRTIYVKLETRSKSKEVQSAFNALINGQTADAEDKYKEILEESTFTAVALGGDSKEHNKIVTKDFDVIRDIIKNNSEFSLKNPAYPISYTSSFLKDNSVAAVHNTTEYIETQATEHSSGKINLEHRGGYVAQFEITWDEISYDADGNEILEPKEWSGNLQGRTAPFTSVIHVPANATNIRIFAKEATGLAWEWWRTILDEHHVPLSSEINVSIGGTTLNPRANIEYK